MIVLNEGITWVWLLSHDKIWYLVLCGWNEKKMKFIELPNVGIKTFGEKKSSGIWNK